MKKVIITLFIGFALFSLMSNQRGRATASGPATGAPGENAGTCANVGCHSAGEFNPELRVSLIDSSLNEVERYIPGQSYTVALNIDHTGLPAGYGFQMVCLENETTAINNFFDFPEGTNEVMVLGRQYVEQNRRLPIDSIPLSWIAPESDSITFFTVANAVNGNGNASGDGTGSGQFTFLRDRSSSVENITQQDITVYPNPVSNILNIESPNAISEIVLFNLNGKQIHSSSLEKIDLSPLDSGIYLLKVKTQSGNSFTKRIIKI